MQLKPGVWGPDRARKGPFLRKLSPLPETVSPGRPPQQRREPLPRQPRKGSCSSHSPHSTSQGGAGCLLEDEKNAEKNQETEQEGFLPVGNELCFVWYSELEGKQALVSWLAANEARKKVCKGWNKVEKRLQNGY